MAQNKGLGIGSLGGGTNVCCCAPGHCTVTICVVTCGLPPAPVPGASVTLKQGTTTHGPFTTDASGCVMSAITAGSWEVIVSAAGYVTSDSIKILACGSTTTVHLLATSDPNVLCIQVIGCCAGLAGATVTFGSVSMTTDSGGNACFGLADAGTYSWSISKNRWITQSGTFTVSDCNLSVSGGPFPGPVQLVPASGYACANTGPTASTTACCNTLNDPIPTTLSCTDSVAGACSLTFNPATGYWYGTLTYSVGGFCGQGPLTYDMNYTFPGGSGDSSCQCVCVPGSTSPRATAYKVGYPNYGSCAIYGNSYSGSAAKPAYGPCHCYGPPEFGDPQIRCCVQSGCKCVSSAITDPLPLDQTTTYTACACYYSPPTSGDGFWLCGGDANTGCCYGGGAAPVITVTE
jgi:hypothetical protein